MYTTICRIQRASSIIVLFNADSHKRVSFVPPTPMLNTRMRLRTYICSALDCVQ